MNPHRVWTFVDRFQPAELRLSPNSRTYGVGAGIDRQAVEHQRIPCVDEQAAIRVQAGGLRLADQGRPHVARGVRQRRHDGVQVVALPVRQARRAVRVADRGRDPVPHRAAEPRLAHGAAALEGLRRPEEGQVRPQVPVVEHVEVALPGGPRAHVVRDRASGRHTALQAEGGLAQTRDPADEVVIDAETIG